MAVITRPSFAVFNAITFRPMFRNQVNRSLWSGARKVMALPGGEYFAFSAAARPVYTEAEARGWRAFVMALRGRENHFYLPVTQNPQHDLTNPTVASAPQDSYTATLDSVPAGGLKAGMFMTFTLSTGVKQLVVLTADVAAGNNQTATFETSLRASATAVETINPYAEVALTNDSSGWDDDNGQFTIAFDCEEAF